MVVYYVCGEDLIEELLKLLEEEFVSCFICIYCNCLVVCYELVELC